MKLILASASPRRKEILTEFGYEFKVFPSDYEENKKDLSPIDLAKFFSVNKAKWVFNEIENKEGILVLGSDTIVVSEGKILGKPKDQEDAFNMLKSLSNKTHQVVSGYALIGEGIEIIGEDVTEVTFNNLTDNLIKQYIEEKKPLDKAGAYGIQDGYPLVKEYKGSYNNIVGLPIEKISPHLNKLLERGREND